MELNSPAFDLLARRGHIVFSVWLVETIFGNMLIMQNMLPAKTGKQEGARRPPGFSLVGERDDVMLQGTVPGWRGTLLRGS